MYCELHENDKKKYDIIVNKTQFPLMYCKTQSVSLLSHFPERANKKTRRFKITSSSWM